MHFQHDFILESGKKMKKTLKSVYILIIIMLLLVSLTGCDKIDKLVKDVNCLVFGHSIILYEGKLATCTEDGFSEAAICERCGYVKNVCVKIGASGHMWSEATCTSPKTCLICASTEGDPLAHNLVDVEGLEPTADTDGYTPHRKCIDCNYIEGKEILSAIGDSSENTGDSEGTDNGTDGDVTGDADGTEGDNAGDAPESGTPQV